METFKIIMILTSELKAFEAKANFIYLFKKDITVNFFNLLYLKIGKVEETVLKIKYLNDLSRAIFFLLLLF